MLLKKNFLRKITYFCFFSSGLVQLAWRYIILLIDRHYFPGASHALSYVFFVYAVLQLLSGFYLKTRWILLANLTLSFIAAAAGSGQFFFHVWEFKSAAIVDNFLLPVLPAIVVFLSCGVFFKNRRGAYP